MKKIFPCIFLSLICIKSNFAYQVWAEFESGAVFQSMNDVEIPSGSATRFSLADFSKGPWPAVRFYLGLEFLEKHELRALAAPLTVAAKGTPSGAISFQNQTFSAGSALTGSYTFNSYRLTYRYKLINTEKWLFYLGFTGKIRDAEISLLQGNLFANRTNTGFVPLLHLHLRYNISPVWAIELDADALASPFGRAEDASLKAVYTFNPEWQLLFGYRTVEGGSKGGGNVYNFAWLHFATVSIRHRF